MAQIRIEIDRGAGWEVRQEGAADVTVADVVSVLKTYTVGDHRAFLDGVLVASSERRRNGRVVVTLA